MKSDRARFLSLTATAAVLALGLAACSGSSSSGGSSPSASASGGSATTTKAPIQIGISLSLTGDFSADGQAFQRGYELWQSDVNSHGGLLGRQVKLTILNDASSPTTVVANYQKLISVNHVDLTFGPFSSLLTAPASTAVARYGYAMIEGAGNRAQRLSRGLQPAGAQHLQPQPAGKGLHGAVLQLGHVAAR